MDKRIYIANLIESDLDRAEVILAAKSIAEEAQAMAEKIAKMQVNELMPLVDRIKETIGQQEAENFNHTVSQQLDQLLDLTKSTKNEIENQVLMLNGEQPAGMSMDNNDMSMGPDALGGDDMGMGDDMDMGLDDVGAVDDFGAADAGSGVMGNPEGRSMRESRKAKLEQNINLLSEQIKRLKAKRK